MNSLKIILTVVLVIINLRNFQTNVNHEVQLYSDDSIFGQTTEAIHFMNMSSFHFIIVVNLNMQLRLLEAHYRTGLKFVCFCVEISTPILVQ